MSPILGIIDSAKTNWLAEGNYYSIASATAAGGSNTSITFSGIPQEYQHLQVHVNAATFDNNERSLLMHYNNDLSTSYDSHAFYTDGSTAAANNNVNTQWNVFFSNGTQGLCGPASYWSSYVIDIYDYSNTTKNKTSMAFGGYNSNGFTRLGFGDSLWRSTAAITQLDFSTTFASGFRAGSTITLYGIK